MEKWSKANESLYHTSEISIQKPGCTEKEFVIEKENTENTFIHLYHVYGIDTKQSRRLLFTIEQKGMDLNKDPMFKWDEEYLYVMFDRIDNEDPKIRIYDGKVGVDPRGFLPKLIRYSILKKTVVFNLLVKRLRK